jgi:hypothetical protein
MSQRVKPLTVVTHEAIRLLIKHIGASDTIRFIRQYHSGYGDYTKEREELFKDLTIDDVVNEIEQMRKNQSSKPSS